MASKYNPKDVRVRTTGGKTIIYAPGSKGKGSLVGSAKGSQLLRQYGLSVRDVSGKNTVGFGNTSISGGDKITPGRVGSNVFSKEKLLAERSAPAKAPSPLSATSRKSGVVPQLTGKPGRVDARGRAAIERPGLANIDSQPDALQHSAASASQIANAPSGIPQTQAASNLLEGKLSPEDLVSADLIGQAESEKKFFGESVSPTSIDEIIANRLEEEARVQKSAAESEARTQEAFNIQQTQQARADKSGIASMQVAAAGIGREGPTSASAPTAQAQLRGVLAERAQLRQIQRDELASNIDTLRLERDEAIKDGRKDLASRIDAQIAQKELEIQQADTDYINALTAQAEEERVAKETGLENISSLIDFLGPQGIAGLEPGVLKGVFSSAGLPASMAVALQDAQRAVSDAALAEDAIALEQAQADLDMTLKQIEDLGKTPQQKNQEFLNEMRESGMSEEAIKEFKIQMGVAEVPDSFADFSGSTSGEGVPGTGQSVNSSLGQGIVTGYGSSLWSPGLDFVVEGGMGAEVIMPFGFEVVEISGEECQTFGAATQSGCNSGFGKQVKIRNTNDGREVWVSHLENFGNIEVGQRYEAGTILGTQGNSGSTLGTTGVHLDITMPDADGSIAKGNKNYLTPQQVASYFNAGGSEAGAEESPVIVDMKNSAGGSTTFTQGQLDGIEKAFMAVTQLQSLTDSLGVDKETLDADGNRVDINPLTGWLKRKNPFDAESQEFEAILQGTIPTVARGIFGEVGVLTDTDIENYKRTLPNLSQTDEVKKLVTHAMLTTVRNGVDTKLRVLAAGGKDVSNFVGLYNDLTSQIDSLGEEIGFSTSSQEQAIPASFDADELADKYTTEAAKQNYYTKYNLTD